MRPSTVTTPLALAPSPRRTRRSPGARSSTSASVGAQTVVGRCSTWLGVDEGLAVEAHRLALARTRRRKPVVVLHVVVDAVEDDLAGLAGGRAARWRGGGPAGCRSAAAEARCGARFARSLVPITSTLPRAAWCGDGAHVEDRRRRLDHRPDRQRCRRAGGVERWRRSRRGRRPSRPSGSPRPAAAPTSGGGGAGRRRPTGSSRPLQRMVSSRLPPYSPDERSGDRVGAGRSPSLSGATASSRSRMIASAGIVFAFSSARSLAAGM
jgi:hypothetical protein